jgi:uncharacterized membrane protein YfcA
LVGFAKTAVSGGGTIAVALFAVALPARESTGALLPLLICGDVLAVGVYRRHADRTLLVRLLPWVAVGIVLGFGFVALTDDRTMRSTIGLMLLLVLAGQVLQRRRPAPATAAGDPAAGGRGAPAEDRGAPADRHRWAAAGAGVAAGFTTMVANAAGPVMTMYLLLRGLGMLQFLGTGAWFYLIVNLVKTPFSGALGLLSARSLMMDLALLPGVLIGAYAGVLLIRRIPPERFQRVVLGMAAIAAMALLI